MDLLSPFTEFPAIAAGLIRTLVSSVAFLFIAENMILGNK